MADQVGGRKARGRTRCARGVSRRPPRHATPLRFSPRLAPFFLSSALPRRLSSVFLAFFPRPSSSPILGPGSSPPSLIVLASPPFLGFSLFSFSPHLYLSSLSVRHWLRLSLRSSPLLLSSLLPHLLVSPPRPRLLLASLLASPFSFLALASPPCLFTLFLASLCLHSLVSPPSILTT